MVVKVIMATIARDRMRGCHQHTEGEESGSHPDDMLCSRVEAVLIAKNSVVWALKCEASSRDRRSEMRRCLYAEPARNVVVAATIGPGVVEGMQGGDDTGKRVCVGWW